MPSIRLDVTKWPVVGKIQVLADSLHDGNKWADTAEQAADIIGKYQSKYPRIDFDVYFSKLSEKEKYTIKSRFKGNNLFNFQSK